MPSCIPLFDKYTTVRSYTEWESDVVLYVSRFQIFHPAEFHKPSQSKADRAKTTHDPMAKCLPGYSAFYSWMALKLKWCECWSFSRWPTPKAFWPFKNICMPFLFWLLYLTWCTFLLYSLLWTYKAEWFWQQTNPDFRKSVRKMTRGDDSVSEMFSYVTIEGIVPVLSGWGKWMPVKRNSSVMKQA